MATELESIISDIGYAKVIVALKPQTAAGAEAAAASLATHFVQPAPRQAETLAAVAMSMASKKFRRPQPLPRRQVRVYPNLGLALGRVDKAGAASLAADARVSAVVPAPELRLIRPVATEAARAPATTTWGIVRLKAQRVWDAGITGKGVVVGHLDTGVDGKHPALKGAIHAFAEFDLAGDQVPNAVPNDSREHGTHTAGTIAGRPGTAKGAFGMAPDAKLASAMVIEGGQVIDRILAGMDWVLGQGARILSMSLGLQGYTPAFQVVVDALRNNNVLPIFAVGNEGPDTSRSPGNYANVLSVGACDRNDQVAWFSGSQSFNRPQKPLVPDLVAPGVGVLSCVPGNGYKLMDGTSMATPHVAGLAALLLQAHPTATANQLEAAILASCTLPASTSPERANRGVPDAVAAVTQLTGNAPIATTSGRGTVSARGGRATKGRARKARGAPRRAAAAAGARKRAKRRRRG